MKPQFSPETTLPWEKHRARQQGMFRVRTVRNTTPFQSNAHFLTHPSEKRGTGELGQPLFQEAMTTPPRGWQEYKKQTKRKWKHPCSTTAPCSNKTGEGNDHLCSAVTSFLSGNKQYFLRAKSPQKFSWTQNHSRREIQEEKEGTGDGMFGKCLILLGLPKSRAVSGVKSVLSHLLPQGKGSASTGKMIPHGTQQKSGDKVWSCSSHTWDRQEGKSTS